MKPVWSILPGLKWKCDDKLCLESVLHCAEHNKDVIPATGAWRFTASGVCWLTAGSTPSQCHIMCALLHLGVLLACFFYIYTYIRMHACMCTHPDQTIQYTDTLSGRYRILYSSHYGINLTIPWQSIALMCIHFFLFSTWKYLQHTVSSSHQTLKWQKGVHARWRVRVCVCVCLPCLQMI